jgi:O-antigen ligase
MFESKRLLKVKGSFYTALLYSFCISLHQQMATVAMILWFVVTVSSKIHTFRLKRADWILGLLPIYFLIYTLWEIIIGQNIHWSLIGHKLSLLVFPIIFVLARYSNAEYEAFFKAFLYGLVVSSLTSLVTSFFASFDFGNGILVFEPQLESDRSFMDSIIYGGNHFFGAQLSRFHQTVYFAMYLCAGLVVVTQLKLLFNSRIRLAITALFILMVFLISNKAGLLCLAFLSILWILNRPLSIFRKILGSVILAVFIGALLLSNPRMRLGLEHFQSSFQGLNPEARYGLNLRLLSWDGALSLIKDRPVFGYGPGETQEALNHYYEFNGYTEPLLHSHNAHNQFLQTWLETGLTGLFVLSAIFIMLFRSVYSKKDMRLLFLGLTLVLFLNAGFESILNRFSGISFFSYLVCISLQQITNNRANIEA